MTGSEIPAKKKSSSRRLRFRVLIKLALLMLAVGILIPALQILVPAIMYRLGVETRLEVSWKDMLY